jgi:hypothetical protein
MKNISDQKDVPCFYNDATIGIGHGCGRRIIEHDVKFVDSIHERAPEGYPFAYSLRGYDRDFGRPATIERNVVVNFWGRIFSKEEILKPEEDFLPIKYFCYE